MTQIKKNEVSAPDDAPTYIPSGGGSGGENIKGNEQNYTWQGKDGLKAGIYPGLSYAEYDIIPALRSTYLCNLNEFPAKAKCINLDTAALKFGRAFHVYSLEGEARFNQSYVITDQCSGVYKSGDRTGQRCGNQGLVYDGQHWYCGQHSKNIIIGEVKQEILTHEDFTLIKAMDRGIKTHPAAKEIMKDGECELTIIWQDKDTQLWCKARVDWKTTAVSNVVIDLKSCRNANPYAFNATVKQRYYFIQAAMQVEGLKVLTGDDYDFAWIASEKELLTDPEGNHITRCECFQADDETWITEGKSRFHSLLRQELLCRENNHWPHYKNAGFEWLMAPGYMTME